MASVCWRPVREARGHCVGGKLKTMQEVRAYIKHCDADERVKAVHTNRNIDTSKTYDVNGQFDLDAESAFSTFKNIITDLDKKPGANHRKDRVLGWGMCIYIPHGVSDPFAFTSEAIKLLKKISPESQIVQAYLHRDEIHEYAHHETGEKVESLAHIHVLVVPEKDGRLSAKNFYTKSNIKRLNKCIDEMCVEKFGCHFMTGEGYKSKLTMEQMKLESAKKDFEAEKQAEIAYLEAEKLKIDMAARASIEARLEADEIRRENTSHKERMAREARESARMREEVEKEKHNIKKEREFIKRKSDALRALEIAYQNAEKFVKSLWKYRMFQESS